MKKILSSILLAFWASILVSFSQVVPGAERMSTYLPLLKGKSVAVFANQTSLVGHTHLIDTLISCGIRVTKIFGPEHGFRGDADAGEKISSEIDGKTGIQVISLYGAHNKPTKEDLQDVDVMIFDIQDVGVRFYTFISSLQYYIESAFELKKPLLILDRPNPNGFYIDGPVLDPKYKSFVGMQPIPVVYGMTIGEYALMLIGEHWLSAKANETAEYYRTAGNSADKPFNCMVIKCKLYDHNTKYILPVKPSPNLPDIQSVYCYPSICFFESTNLSEGRGTHKPFQLFGHPTLPNTLDSFTPRSMPSATKPKLKDKLCYGWDISGNPDFTLKQINKRVQIKYILEAYKIFPDKKNFFLKPGAINRLAGNDLFEQQIVTGESEANIRKSWEPALNKFKKIRKKYLLYHDFN